MHHGLPYKNPRGYRGYPFQGPYETVLEEALAKMVTNIMAKFNSGKIPIVQGLTATVSVLPAQAYCLWLLLGAGGVAVIALLSADSSLDHHPPSPHILQFLFIAVLSFPAQAPAVARLCYVPSDRCELCAHRADLCGAVWVEIFLPDELVPHKFAISVSKPE